MKQFPLLIVFILTAGYADTQGNAFHVPQEVNQAFTLQYPKSRLKKWEQDQEGEDIKKTRFETEDLVQASRSRTAP